MESNKTPVLSRVEIEPERVTMRLGESIITIESNEIRIQAPCKTHLNFEPMDDLSKQSFQ